MRALAQNAKVSVQKIHDMSRQRLICPYMRNMTPLLPPAERKARLDWSNSHICKQGVVNDMMEYIHLNVMSLFVNHNGSNVYLTVHKFLPHAVSKAKVTFLAAIARPRTHLSL